MNPRWRRLLAVTVTAVSSAFVVGGLVLIARGTSGNVQVSEFLTAAAFTTVGGVLTVKRGDNALSWLFAAVGLATAFLAANNQMSKELAGAQYVAWFGWWGFLIGVGLLSTFVLLLFPDGRLPGRRWRPVAWAAGAGLFLLGWSEALMPAEHTGSEGLPNPFAVPALQGLLEVGFMVGTGLLFAGILSGVAAVVVRFRRAAGLERQQIKWVLFAAAWGVALWVAGNFAHAAWGVSWDLIMAGAILPLPAAVLVAVLRYRLYEIDRIVSRTLVYGLLSVLLAGIYLAAVTGLTALTAPVTRESPFAVAAATLLAAAAFGPARRRIQAGVDRRFNRSRYDARRTVEQFSARMRDEVDIEQLSAELHSVSSTTLQPTVALLWIRQVES